MKKNKKCGKCKNTKLLLEFHKKSVTKDGYCGTCKICESKYAKIYRGKHRERLIKHYKKFRDKNKEKISNWQKKYREINKKELFKRGKKYRDANKEKVSKRRKKSYYANREYYLQKSREDRKLNPERHRASRRKRRALQASVNESYSKENEKLTLKTFDNKCFNCGTTNDLTIDHHRPLSKGWALCISNAVVLCRSCNSSKGIKDPQDFYGHNKYISANIYCAIAYWIPKINKIIEQSVLGK